MSIKLIIIHLIAINLVRVFIPRIMYYVNDLKRHIHIRSAYNDYNNTYYIRTNTQAYIYNSTHNYVLIIRHQVKLIKQCKQYLTVNVRKKTYYDYVNILKLLAKKQHDVYGPRNKVRYFWTMTLMNMLQTEIMNSKLWRFEVR